ncbi:MAG: methyltransferase domain-containing protein [Abditibacteriales bacterium]|nr:methyltransferase domain-containing protein [Abditibacteriales bacterium]MDW8367672.1 class I SAM-dependent methyltransferase [Abditibacteriales bacterium]
MELYTEEKDEVVQEVARVLANEMNNVYSGNWEQNARDHLSPIRAQEQFDVLSRFVPDLTGKRILEIGSSFGSMHALLCRRGVDAYAIEPDVTRIRLGRRFWRVLAESHSRVVAAIGEALPFADETFDVVFSSNVLEHVRSPATVLSETRRVLKRGGLMHVVVPNYGSIWEGHYALFWIPYLPPQLGKWYVRLYGRDPSFIDTLQFINPLWLRRLLWEVGGFEVIDEGIGLWQERLASPHFSAWSGLAKLQPLVRAAQKLGVVRFVQAIGGLLKLHTPIILTARKVA